MPHREGISLTLAQYDQLRSVCDDLLNHIDMNNPFEKDLGFNVSVRNKLCMSNRKMVRKIIFFNNKTCEFFELELDEFNNWYKKNNEIALAISEVQKELTEESV